MAEWVTPVTDRASGAAMMTYEDMNRITGNLVWLYEESQRQGITVEGDPYSKTTWVQNDIITRDEWRELLICLNRLRQAIGYSPGNNPGYAMLWSNINKVEEHELMLQMLLYTRDAAARMNHYIGDKLTASYLYAGDDFNAGGLYE